MNKKKLSSKKIDRQSTFTERLLFPSFNEMYYMTAFTTLVALTIFSPEYREFMWSFITDDIRGLFYPFLALGLAYFMVKKHNFSTEAKMGICVLYYGFFAIIAFSVLEDKTLQAQYELLEYFNELLTVILLVIAVARLVITLIVYRFEWKNAQEYITASFKDDQYRPWGFVFVTMLTLVFMYILSGYYDNATQLALYTYIYSLGIMRVLDNLPFQLLKH